MASAPPQDERSEFSLSGPFAGILADSPASLLEDASGFLDLSDIILRKGVACARPAYNTIQSMGGGLEPVLSVADFFNSVGTRINVIITPTRVFQWVGGVTGWQPIVGALNGTVDQLFTWTVVAHKLLFCQGVDKVKAWDGITSGFADVSANAVPARFLMEIGGRLIAAYTYESATQLTQRFRYTGPGDPTDWTSFSAGVGDLFNDLGPITGAIKLYQSAYLFQQWGITQLNPTGLALRPFDIIPLSSHSKGNICPYSLGTFGEMEAPYVGKDNIYSFNGSLSDPIGDMPIDGSRTRLGARKRIFADLQTINFQKVFGIVTTSINGNDYNAYWLFLPNVATWVFNFDERNWTRFTWDKTATAVGTFIKAAVVQIGDLQGPIYAQSWTPASLTNNNPLDSILVTFSDGTIGNIDWSNFAEGGCSMLTGQIYMKDRRHYKTLNALRILHTDLGAVNYTVIVTNEKGETRTVPVSFGSGTGFQVTLVIPMPKITGNWFTIKLVVGPGSPWCVSEITSLYEVGAEVRS